MINRTTLHRFMPKKPQNFDDAGALAGWIESVEHAYFLAGARHRAITKGLVAEMMPHLAARTGQPKPQQPGGHDTGTVRVELGAVMAHQWDGERWEVLPAAAPIEPGVAGIDFAHATGRDTGE